MYLALYGVAMNSKIKTNFEEVRTDLEEHLNSINENSTEIQALFDYLQDMEVKIDKLNARLDQVQLTQGDCEKQEIESLNSVEKQIFLVLYTEEIAMGLKEIAEKAKVPITLVQEYITSLSKKGIPLVRSLFNGQIFIQLDKGFKERQAKENLINLSLDSFF